MPDTATKTKPALWKRIVSEVKSGSKGGPAGKWSARKAQLATARYKKAGGGYRGKKSSSNSLSKWTKQKWRTSDGSPSRNPGRKSVKRYLPDKAWKNMSAKEKASANRSKSAGSKKGKTTVSLPKKIKKKVAKYRK
jgi:hypothetical protein